MTPGQICDKCKNSYKFSPADTVIYWYENAPWFSFGHTTCPNCHHAVRAFMRDTYLELLQYFTLNEFGFFNQEFPDAEIVAAFEETYGLSEIKEVALNPRHEEEIYQLHIVLEGIPDDLLVSLFTDPMPPKERPETWI